MQIWRFWKKSWKTWRLGPQTWRFPKYSVCIKLKRNNRLFVWVFFCLFSDSVSLSSSRQQVAIFEICACVRRLSFPRDLSAPMFHWNWHCTQLFSQVSLINLAIMNKDYSIFLHTLRNFFSISKFSGSPWDLEAKPWDCEMASQTVRVGRSVNV